MVKVRYGMAYLPVSYKEILMSVLEDANVAFGCIAIALTYD